MMRISDPALQRTKTFATALFAFSVFVSVTAVEAALFLLAGVLYLEARGRREGNADILSRAARQPLFGLWMFYLSAGLLAAAFALEKGRAFAYLPSDLIKYLCFSALLASLKDRFLDTAAEFYAAGAVFSAAAGTAHVAWFFSSFGTFYQRAGAFSNPVRYGEMLVIAFAFAVSAVLLPPPDERPGRRKFRLAALFLLFMTILLTRTRGSYVGLALIPVTIFAFDRHSRGRVAAWAGILVLLAGLAAAFNPYIRGRIVTPYSEADASGVVHPAPHTLTVGNRNAVGINIRLELWKLGIRIFRDHPVLGVGPANVKPAFRIYHPEPLGVQQVWGSLHSLYLNQLAERGLVGLAALLSLFGGMFLFALRNFRKERNAFTLWAVAVLPSFFAMNLTEVSFQHIHTSFAVILALAASANSTTRRGAIP